MDTFLLYTVNGLHIAFSNIPVTCYLLSIVNLVVNSVYFLLTEIITRGNQGIIIKFYYLIQNINEINVIFRKDKHNPVSLNIKFMFIRWKIGERLSAPFL
jgi:hypothetical protein